VAEQWGRRWITIDTSRVPLALTRQRLLTAIFPYYELADSARGPAGGFIYRRRQNSKSQEIGGIVPHITLKSIATGEAAEEEVLVDIPEKDDSIVRITGRFPSKRQFLRQLIGMTTELRTRVSTRTRTDRLLDE
jgi:adenine-specific DNA-methyltransferase